MAMGKRKAGNQGELWVSAKDLAAAPGHPFYARASQLLEKHGFDRMAEEA